MLRPHRLIYALAFMAGAAGTTDVAIASVKRGPRTMENVAPMSPKQNLLGQNRKQKVSAVVLDRHQVTRPELDHVDNSRIESQQWRMIILR